MYVQATKQKCQQRAAVFNKTTIYDRAPNVLDSSSKRKSENLLLLWSRERCTFLPSYVSREGQLIQRQFWSRIDQCWVSAAVVLRHEHNGMMMGRLTVSRRHFVTSQKNTESDSAHRSACCNKKNKALYNENE